MILRDQQIGSAVVVVIAGDDGARMFKMNLVEPNVSGHIFESIGAEIAKQLDLTLAVFRFADGDEIYPAVVVVVEGGNAVATSNPVRFRKRHTLEALAVVVAPQSVALPIYVGERNVHPAIVVKIKNRNSSRGGRKRCGPNSLRNEFSFAWILENSRSAIGHDNVYGTVIVVVAADDAYSARRSRLRQPQLVGDIRKRSVAVVAEHLQSSGCVVTPSQEEVEVAIMIVINQGRPEMV